MERMQIPNMRLAVHGALVKPKKDIVGNKSNEDEGGETGKKVQCSEEAIVSSVKEKEGDTVQTPEAGNDRKEEGNVTSGKQKECDSVHASEVGHDGNVLAMVISGKEKEGDNVQPDVVESETMEREGTSQKIDENVWEGDKHDLRVEVLQKQEAVSGPTSKRGVKPKVNARLVLKRLKV